MATSPAQQAFRDFNKDINQMTKMIVNGLKHGELYTRDLITVYYEEIAALWLEFFEENEFNLELWSGRIEQVVSDKSDGTTTKYNLPDSVPDEEPPETDSGGGVGEIAGFPIITSGDCVAGGGRVRGQILLTLEELVEYLEPIPAEYISGIIIVTRPNGSIEGFSVCGRTR